MSHALLSPSGSGIWTHCTAQPLFVQRLKLPEEPSSPYAQEGIDAHEVFAEALGLSNPHEVAYNTEEQVKYLPAMLDHILTVLSLHPGAKLYREVRVDPKRFVGTSHCYGTCDVLIVTREGVIYIYDLKFGANVPVDVIDNTQIILYGLGALARFKYRKFKEVVLGILQPRAPHPEGPIREWRLSIPEIMEWAEKLKHKARQVLNGTGIFAPSADTCRWCPARGVCRARATHHLRHIRTIFGEIEDDLAEFKDPEQLSPEELAFLLDEAPDIRRWLSDVSEATMGTLRLGTTVPGWGLRTKLSSRRWAVFVEELENYFAPEVLYANVIRTPPQVEKILGRGVVDDFVERVETGLVLCRESDATIDPIFTEIEDD